MISVFTISRQYGSGGSTFAKLLAEYCGYDLVWREVINQAAKQIGAPDVALAMIDEFELLGLCPDEKTCQAYLDAVAKIMLQFANSGKQIIVGRASHIVLKDLANVMRIRVIASKPTRIANVCKSKNVNHEAAIAQIEQSDRYRSMYLERFYHVEWNEPSHFDLTINTDHISSNSAARWVAQFSKE